MSKTLATHFGLRALDAALVADHAAVLHALVLAAEALPVGDRAEDLRAEQAVAFRLERAVVDRLGLGDLAERPRHDLLGRGQRDADRVEVSAERGLGVVESRTHRVTRAPKQVRLRSSAMLRPAFSSSRSARHRDRATAVRE